MSNDKRKIERHPVFVRALIGEFSTLYPDDECVKNMVQDAAKDNLLNDYKVSDNIWSQLINAVRLHQDEDRCHYREKMYSLYVKDKFVSDPLPADWGVPMDIGRELEKRAAEDDAMPVIRVPKRVRVEDSMEVVRSTRRCIVDDTFVCFDRSDAQKGFDLVDKHDAYIANAGYECNDVSDVRIDLVVAVPAGNVIDAKTLLQNYTYRYTYPLTKRRSVFEKHVEK